MICFRTFFHMYGMFRLYVSTCAVIVTLVRGSAVVICRHVGEWSFNTYFVYFSL